MLQSVFFSIGHNNSSSPPERSSPKQQDDYSFRENVQLRQIFADNDSNLNFKQAEK